MRGVEGAQNARTHIVVVRPSTSVTAYSVSVAGNKSIDWLQSILASGACQGTDILSCPMFCIPACLLACAICVIHRETASPWLQSTAAETTRTQQPLLQTLTLLASCPFHYISVRQALRTPPYLHGSGHTRLTCRAYRPSGTPNLTMQANVCIVSSACQCMQYRPSFRHDFHSSYRTTLPQVASVMCGFSRLFVRTIREHVTQHCVGLCVHLHVALPRHRLAGTLITRLATSRRRGTSRTTTTAPAITTAELPGNSR